MITYKCKCGKAVAWSSMGKQPCQGCDKCGTQYSMFIKGPFPERIPHDWQPKYNENTGAQDWWICKRCSRLTKENPLE